MKQVETILNDIAQESGFDNWEQYFECFRTTEPGRRVINKGIRKAVTKALRKHAVIGSFSMHDLMLYYQDAENFDFTSKAIDVLNSMVNDR